MKYPNIREEELKNRISVDLFPEFNTVAIVGNIDFTVLPKHSPTEHKDIPLLWAEAKTGNADIATMFVQLILTIGKARTFDKSLPPTFLGAFDSQKMAFVAYDAIQDIFYLNDFNWNVTPSNHQSKEFKLIKDRIEATIQTHSYVYDYETDAKELRFFIANNIAKATETSKIKIDKNNFVSIYLRWLETIKPIIEVNWDDIKEVNILDSDFYLADLFVDDQDNNNVDNNITIQNNLFVIYKNSGYKIAKENIKQITKAMFDIRIELKDKTVYQQFWQRYKRPPIQTFHDYIIERRDLLVPQDIRERKGAFFTPRMWVELSQHYLADVLGQTWQDEYYIWDCAAGTGNLLAGLTNKYNIWASTLDQADVNVMHERINHGANLLKSHVFQFDFLNDDFSKLPQSLQSIINDPEKRKKLVMYINPPYAEHGNLKQLAGTGHHKIKVATETTIHHRYKNILSAFRREVFAQFLIRIYFEIPDCIIGEFSKIKLLTDTPAKMMRKYFLATIEKSFIVPAFSFDNVKGQFPIAFKIWDTSKKEKFISTVVNVFEISGKNIGIKTIKSFEMEKKINKWLTEIKEDTNGLGYLSMGRNDFQHKNLVFIINSKKLATNYSYPINIENIQKITIYFAVQKVIPATWLNDRDQFLFPNEGWQTDLEFQNNCLTYTLFNNNIQSRYGTNHWIPFTEVEVNAQDKFASHFMTDFIKNPAANPKEKRLQQEMFAAIPLSLNRSISTLRFSTEAVAVFDAGRALWKYYHAQKNVNVNASLYDIKEYFQRRNDKGRMKAKSTDIQYTELMNHLRDSLKILAEKIAPKVYEYGFLRG